MDNVALLEVGTIANQRGEVITVILIAIVAVAALLGVGFVVDQTLHPPCDPKTTQCIEFPGGSVEVPK